MKAAVTGHRPNKLGYEWEHVGPCSTYITDELRTLVQVYGVKEGYSGMALGADMLWAVLLLRMGIPLHCYIPFKGQELRWPPDSQRIYLKILNKATDIYVVDIGKHCNFNDFLKLPLGGYSGLKMQNRNIAMVNAVDILFKVHDGSTGGTANCIKYAESIGKNIVGINPKNYNHV